MRGLCAACLLALAACEADTSAPASAGLLDPEAVAFDTVLSVGELDGVGAVIFGHATAGVLLPGGGFAALDRTGPTVAVFGPDGELRGTHGTRGEGPGELMSPSVLSVDGAGHIRVLDGGRRRLIALAFQDGDLRLMDDLRAEVQFPSGMCSMDDGTTWIASGGDAGYLARVPAGGGQTDILGSWSELGVAPPSGLIGPVRGQLAVGRVFCDQEPGMVVRAFTGLPGVVAHGAMDSDGAMDGDAATDSDGAMDGEAALHGKVLWETRLGGLWMPEGGGPDGPPAFPEEGRHGLLSMFQWDGEHVAVQYVFNDRRGGGDPVTGVETLLLRLDTGAEVARTRELPGVVDARGDRFLATEQTPVPRFLVLERRMVEGDG